MKRLLLGACAFLLLLTFGPVPKVSAGWWWHHHSDPTPAGVGADKQMKREKVHRDHYHEQHEALYTSPRSFGWSRHASPGPIGFGSGHSESAKTTAHREEHQQEKSAQSSQKHHFFPWFHHDQPTPGQGASTTGAE